MENSILSGTGGREANHHVFVEMPNIPQPEPPYRLMLEAQRGIALHPLIRDRMDRLMRQPADAALLMDLTLALQLYGRREDALAYQKCALQLSRLYADPAPGPAALRLLCFVAPGDLWANMPVELLVHGSNVSLFKLYVGPGETLPQYLPDHDVALVAISESDENRETLRRLGDALADWPRPVVNLPAHILRLSRDGVAELLQDIPGLVVPWTVRLSAQNLTQALAAGLLPNDAFPLIIRPVGSHAGKGLACLADTVALVAYLEGAAAEQFFLSPFVEYRSADGHYRKYRIAFIKGRPFLCHLAIAEHWIVHYGEAGMDRDADKRAEEQRVMESFDDDFAARHRPAFSALSERIGLDFLTVDCGETPEGELLFFEADHAGAIHDLDPPDIFPYKQVQMRRVFAAFAAMLRAAA